MSGAPDMLAAALAAYDAGLCVVRVGLDGNKKPMSVGGWGAVNKKSGERGAGWKRFQTERATRDTVTKWFARNHPGLGVICGKVSGNLEMLELEARAVNEGLFDRLVELAKAEGRYELLERVVNGYTETTPSGGLHWLYRVLGIDVAGNTKLAMRRKTDDELLDDPSNPNFTMIETRGEGGFTVCAPSHGAVHRSGKPYELIRGSFATIPTLTAAEYEQLHDLCRQLSEVSSVEPPPPAPLDPDKRVKVTAWSGGVVGKSWIRAVTHHLASRWTMRSLLEHYGWQHHHDADGMTYMVHPSAHHDWSASINSNDRVVLFTSSLGLAYYDGKSSQTSSYGLLDMVAYYEDNGDHMAAARRIADETGIYARWEAEQQATWQAEQEEFRRLVGLAGNDHDHAGDNTTGATPTTPATTDTSPTTTGTTDTSPATTGAAVVVPDPDGVVVIDDALDAPDGYRYSDLGNALRLVAKTRGNLRYVPKWRRWIVYDGGRWRLDHADTLVSYKAGQIGKLLLTKSYIHELWKIADEKTRKEAVARHLSWARRSEMAAGMAGTIGAAASIPGVAIDHSLLDADPWLFNCTNGTVELRTQVLRPHSADDLLTMQAAVAYDPTATAPQFLAFITEILPDPEVRRFVQRLFGIVLVGAQVEHILLVALGAGANGKSTLTKIVADILGDYAVVASVDLLLALKHDTHPTSKASLFRRRFAHSGELPQGAKLDEAQIKRLTGGDEIVARRMREDEWQFIPSHTLFLHANHRPAIDGTDDGIWRRVLLIPFDVQIPPERRDSRLADTIVAEESAGVLRWMLDGLADYLEHGLCPPDIVKVATNAYREASDTVAAFLTDHGATFVPGATVSANYLMAIHGEWFNANGIGDKEKDHYQRVVGELKRRGVEQARNKARGRYWRGLALGGDNG